MNWRPVNWRRFLAVFSPVGVSLETVVVSVFLALILGVFPMYGVPTLLCTAAAFVFRLNLPAMQAVNLISSPLQFALWAPFTHLGSRLVHLPGSREVAARIGAALLHAVAGWCCIAVPLGILTCLTIRLVLRGMERTRLQAA